MSYIDIMSLPFAVFLGYMKHLRVFDIEQTPEGYDMLYNNKALYAKEPDWNRLRSSNLYQKKQGGE